MLDKADILKLKAVVDLPPHAGKEDGEVARLLSLESTATEIAPIETKKLLGLIVNNGLYAALEATKATSQVSRMVLDLLKDSPIEFIDISERGPIGMMAALEAAGTMTAAQKADIVSASTLFLTEVEKLLGQGKTIHHLDVAKARRG